jgi:IS30 family transposase
LKRRFYTKTEIFKMQDLALEGLTQHEIAIELNRSESSISTKLREWRRPTEPQEAIK